MTKKLASPPKDLQNSLFLTRNDISLAKISPKFAKTTKAKELPKINFSSEESDFPTILEKHIYNSEQFNVLSEADWTSLKLEPNKFSIFKSKIKPDSPTTKQAINNLNIKKEDEEIKSFSEFELSNLARIKQFYFEVSHLNSKCDTIKAIIRERNRLKLLSKDIRKNVHRKLFNKNEEKQESIAHRKAKSFDNNCFHIDWAREKAEDQLVNRNAEKNIQLASKEVNEVKIVKENDSKEDGLLENKAQKIEKILAKKEKFLSDIKERAKLKLMKQTNQIEEWKSKQKELLDEKLKSIQEKRVEKERELMKKEEISKTEKKLRKKKLDEKERALKAKLVMCQNAIEEKFKKVNEEEEERAERQFLDKKLLMEQVEEERKAKEMKEFEWKKKW